MSGFYSWGYQLYTVNNSGFDLTYHWGSGFASGKLFVGDGNDKFFGNISSDKVHTGGGNDLIRGGAGNDILVGGAGRDIMRGGKGDDIFYIGDLASTLRTADAIKDYGKGNDMLSFVTGTYTVYVKNTGKNTILQDGSGDDAEIYAILQGYRLAHYR